MVDQPAEASADLGGFVVGGGGAFRLARGVERVPEGHEGGEGAVGATGRAAEVQCPLGVADGGVGLAEPQLHLREQSLVTRLPPMEAQPLREHESLAYQRFRDLCLAPGQQPPGERKPGEHDRHRVVDPGGERPAAPAQFDGSRDLTPREEHGSEIAEGDRHSLAITQRLGLAQGCRQAFLRLVQSLLAEVHDAGQRLTHLQGPPVVRLARQVDGATDLAGRFAEEPPVTGDAGEHITRPCLGTDLSTLVGEVGDPARALGQHLDTEPEVGQPDEHQQQVGQLIGVGLSEAGGHLDTAQCVHVLGSQPRAGLVGRRESLAGRLGRHRVDRSERGRLGEPERVAGTRKVEVDQSPGRLAVLGATSPGRTLTGEVPQQIVVAVAATGQRLHELDVHQRIKQPLGGVLVGVEGRGGGVQRDVRTAGHRQEPERASAVGVELAVAQLERGRHVQVLDA